MIAPYYPFTKNAESFCVGNTEASHAHPPPNGGGVGEKGVIIYLETGFIQSKKIDMRIGNMIGDYRFKNCKLIESFLSI
jgi:hypothetical protein